MPSIAQLLSNQRCWPQIFNVAIVGWWCNELFSSTNSSSKSSLRLSIKWLCRWKLNAVLESWNLSVLPAVSSCFKRCAKLWRQYGCPRTVRAQQRHWGLRKAYQRLLLGGYRRLWKLLQVSFIMPRWPRSFALHIHLTFVPLYSVSAFLRVNSPTLFQLCTLRFTVAELLAALQQVGEKKWWHDVAALPEMFRSRLFALRKSTWTAGPRYNDWSGTGLAKIAVLL